MTPPLKKYFCRLPQACVDLIKFEAARVGARYSTSRALVQNILEDFLYDAPWSETAWEFPSVPDVRKYGGEKTGSVQYNIFVSPDLGLRVDGAIQDAGASRASFFLGAVCWWLCRNLQDAQAKKLFAETAKSIGFRCVEMNGEDEVHGDAGNKQVQQSRRTRITNNDNTAPDLAAFKKNKHLPEYDHLFMQSSQQNALEHVQRGKSTGLVSSEQLNAELGRLKFITEEYGSDADGSSSWFVGQDGKSDSTSFRKRATMVVLRVTNGKWKMVRCYRTNVRAKPTQTSNLTLAPLVHARRGTKALDTFVSGEARVLYPSPGEFLKKQCASEPLAFWLGFLIRAVATDVVAPDEVFAIVSWRLNKSGIEENEVLNFAREIFPRINGRRTLSVMKLIDGGCDDAQALVVAMAQSTDRINDPDCDFEDE